MIYKWGEQVQAAEFLEKHDIALGAFDALHAGHLHLINHLDKQKSVVTLFEPLPAQIFNPQFSGSIYSFRQRCQLMSDLGVKHILRIDFSREFSKMLGDDFLSGINDCIPLRKIVVGADFCMGQGRTFCVKEIESWGMTEGIEVTVVPHYSLQGEEKMSATDIREAIVQADFARAEKILGRSYALDLLDFPVSATAGGGFTVDLREAGQVLPPDGNYETQLGRVAIKDKVLSLSMLESECVFKEKVQ